MSSRFLGQHSQIPTYTSHIYILLDVLVCSIAVYYIDTDVLLKNIPLVKFIKNTSGTLVVYFP